MTLLSYFQWEEMLIVGMFPLSTKFDLSHVLHTSVYPYEHDSTMIDTQEKTILIVLGEFRGLTLISGMGVTIFSRPTGGSFFMLNAVGGCVFKNKIHA